MPQAQGSRVQLAIIPEVTFGVTPATPQTQLIDFVNFTSNLVSENLRDPSIRASRQNASLKKGNSRVEAQLEVVLAPDNYDVLLEAALQGTWTANVLKIGNVQRSIAFEQGFMDLGQYRVFNGMVINTASVTASTDGFITANFGMMGRSQSALTATSLDTTPTLITTKENFIHIGGSFMEGGVVASNITQIDWELNNNAEGTTTLGSGLFREVTSKKIMLTGTVSGLFDSVDLYNKYISGADSSISTTYVAGAETLKFEFPRVKYTSGAITSSGDAGVTVEMQFEALEDATGNSMTITRV